MMKHWRVYGLLVIAALAIGLYRVKTEAEAVRLRVEAKERAVAARAAEVQGQAVAAQSLADPRRIEDLAARELGMRPAGPGQTIDPDAMDAIAPVETGDPP